MFHRQNRHINISKQSDKCRGRCWRWCMVQPASYCQTPICNLHTNAYIWLQPRYAAVIARNGSTACLANKCCICSRGTRLQRFKAGRGVAGQWSLVSQNMLAGMPNMRMQMQTVCRNGTGFDMAERVWNSAVWCSGLGLVIITYTSTYIKYNFSQRTGNWAPRKIN